MSADGITYSLGIFLVEFMQDFKVGSEATSWIASILVAVTLGSGEPHITDQNIQTKYIITIEMSSKIFWKYQNIIRRIEKNIEISSKNFGNIKISPKKLFNYQNIKIFFLKFRNIIKTKKRRYQNIIEKC